MIRLRAARLRRDERGFTLPELITTIAILGILVAIGVIIFLAILERWRVNTAADQLASDLRRTHSSATNQLTDWRVVLVPERGDKDDGPDYYLIRLNGVYKSGSSKPGYSPDTAPVSRSFPANVKIMNQEYSPEAKSAGRPIVDNKEGKYYLAPSETVPTRSLEFNSNGTMTGYVKSPSGTVRVTIDENPTRAVRYLAPTSQVRVLP